MFYSEDFRLAKGGGMSIIWLAATLGIRSKKVTKRAVLACDVSATCEQIIDPVEPIALRTSAGLLVGVVRVYDNKVEILQKDVETLETTVRKAALDLTIGTGNLDMAGGGIARHEQITIQAGDSGVDLDLGTDALEWQNFLKDVKGRGPARSNSREGTASIDRDTDDHDRREDSEERKRADEDDPDDPLFRRRMPSLAPKSSPNALGTGASAFRSSQEPLGVEDIDLGLGEEGLGLDMGDMPNGLDGALGGDFEGQGYDGGFSSSGFGMNVGEAFMEMGLDGEMNMDGLLGDEMRAGSAVPSHQDGKASSGKSCDSEKMEQEIEANDQQAKKRKRPAKKSAKQLEKDKALEIEEERMRKFRNEYGKRMDELRQEQLDKEGQKLQIAHVRFGVDTMMTSFQFTAPTLCAFLADAAKAKYPSRDRNNARGEGSEAAGHFGVDLEQPAYEYQGDGFLQEMQPEMQEMQGMDFQQDMNGINADYESVGHGRGAPRFPWEAQSYKGSDLVGDLGPSGAYPASSDTGGVAIMGRMATPSSVQASLDTGRGSKMLQGHRSSSVAPSAKDRRQSSEPAGQQEQDYEMDDGMTDGTRGKLPPGMLDETTEGFYNWVRSVAAEEDVFQEDHSIYFDHLAPVRTSNRSLAATAFYNCLTLATKTAIQVAQVASYGPISIKPRA